MVFEVLVCPDDIGATAYASRAYLATALMQFIERDRPAFHTAALFLASSLISPRSSAPKNRKTREQLRYSPTVIFQTALTMSFGDEDMGNALLFRR